jgi:gliding motility-associated-like protein
MKRSIPGFLLPGLFMLIACTPASAGDGNATWNVNWETPKVFIENRGQFVLPACSARSADGKTPIVLYAFDNGGSMIYFTTNGIVYSYFQRVTETERENEHFRNEKDWRREEEKEKKCEFRSDVATMTWGNANPDVTVTAEDQAPDYYNYSFKTNGEEISLDFIRAFRKITYKNLYPGIDVEFIFHPVEGIKYTLILHPGANISQVSMNWSDVNNITLGKSGEVHVPTAFGDIIDHAPVTFYRDNTSEIIASSFVKKGKTISFLLGEYDHTKTLAIDPWTITGTGFGNSNRIWECDKDAAGNVYLYGGDTPLRLKKYNSSGVLQWTYNTPWDSAGYWLGTLITDIAGVSYVTSGSNGEIRKVNTSGTLVWSNNPNGAFGPLYEYWHLAFNCDQTQLVVGGMRAPSPFSTNQFRGVVVNINLATGAVASYTTVGWIAGFNIKEARTICSSPNGNYYFLTLDSIGCVNSALALTWKASSGYNFSYGSPSYSIKGNLGLSSIRATSNFIYTQNGITVHKRDISTGAIVATAAIPGGISTTVFGSSSPGNSGLDIDSCGNVYVGSGNAIVKYDANLALITSVATTSAVYDVAVTKNGEVVACGNNFAVSVNMSACNPVQNICSLTSPLAVTSAQTNITCNALCNGSASVTASGGTGPYTYAWNPTGGNSSSATGLCAGTYTCTITDNVGATTTASFNITQPTAVTATQSQTNLSCNSVCNGSATVVASGGTPGYSYAWSPSGGNAATASSLCQGNYTCTITDASGCTATKTFLITQPAVLSASMSSSNATCNSICDGTATVSANGGTGPFTYSWLPSGGNAATASNLCAAGYTVTITDANGCTTTQSVTITEPVLLSATATSTPTGCSVSTGSATATASGGTGIYTYNWAPTGGTNAVANNLGAGTYTVTITDANGCTTTANASVASAGGPVVSVQSATDVSCFGINDGSSAISASGNGPFTYAWAPSGGNSANAGNLSANTYTVTITDVNGCSSTQTVLITEPPQLAAAISSTPATCGNNDGSATVIASGGTSGYSYSWNPSGGNAATEINLATGTYTVTITDANGCTISSSTTVTNSGGPTVSVQSFGNVTCFGSSDGSGTISASGNGPFTYNWAPSGGNAAVATGLSPGTYSVTVTDANGCTSVQTITITEPAQLLCTPSSTPATCGNPNGSATAGDSGGTGPYTYSWTGGQTTQTATNLTGGLYTVTVTDANGCAVTGTVNVTTTGGPAISLQSSADVSCFGFTDGSATVNTTGNGPFTYSWSPTGGTSATATNLGAGIYSVTVTDVNGCAQTQTVVVTQPPALQISSAGVDENCNNNDGSASATVSGGAPGYTYSWSNGAITATISNLVAGNYTLTVTDTNGCTGTSTVVISSISSATADAGTYVTISQGNTTMLNGTGNGTFTWTPPGSLDCPTCEDPVASPSVTTTYTVVVTDSLGCTATDTVTVYVDIACGEVYLPNAFSPNGDLQNDVLYVRGNCIKFMQFDVYNRWGERVFSTTDPAIGWDGSWRGKPCEAAVFTYVLRATLLDGSEVKKQGNISLVK